MARTLALVFSSLVAAIFSLTGCGQASDEHPGSTTADSVGGVIDVTAAPYGAQPGVDAYAAIQAAINASCASTATIKVPVYIPQGIYPLSAPLQVTCTTELFGASRQGTVLKPSFNGPAILVESSTTALTTGPALIGTGNSLTSTLRMPPVLNLRDVPAVELDGLTQFTAEAFVEISSYNAVTSTGSIVWSEGGLGRGQYALTGAFGLSVT